MSYLLTPFLISLIAACPSVILFYGLRLFAVSRDTAESLAVIAWIGLIIYLAQ